MRRYPRTPQCCTTFYCLDQNSGPRFLAHDAAFLLGALGTWWASATAKKTAGNLAIVSLGQMYGILENVRHTMFVEGPVRIEKALHRSALSFEIRGTIGLPGTVPSVPMEQIGFLVDSRDPDLLNRLLHVERAFTSVLDLVHRHTRLHGELTTKLNAADPTGVRPMSGADLVAAVGVKPLIEIADLIEELQISLPDARDAIVAVTRQLREVLRLHMPSRRFVNFTPAPRSRTMDQPPALPRPAHWRVVVRRLSDSIHKHRYGEVAQDRNNSAAALGEQSHEITRFPSSPEDRR